MAWKSIVRHARIGAALLIASAGVASAQPADPKTPAPVKDAATAPAKAPGLAVGEHAPDAKLADAAGKSVELSAIIKDGPVIVVFYRGGWCPFCTKHLAQWTHHADELKQLGVTFVAISPEKPEELAKTAEKNGLKFRMLCDTSMDAAKGFKLAFDMDEKTVTKYKGYGMDLAKSNAIGAWTLPHPATFVIDTDGVVRYASASKDYTKRADPKEAIEAIRKMKESK